jgi:hypothetical protein
MAASWWLAQQDGGAWENHQKVRQEDGGMTLLAGNSLVMMSGEPNETHQRTWHGRISISEKNS